MSESEPDDHPRIVVPPPLILAVFYAAGWLLEEYVRTLAFTVPPSSALRLSGEVLIILGAILSLWAVLTFRRARTTLLPFRPATALVTNGPFRFSRNPMYVGMTTVYVGAALAMNMAWPLLLLPMALIALVRLVIAREERYLQRAFPDDYNVYRRRVRRWV
jgi:protein-S-isoprenylcysteine O-methyltransferase Ste14